MFSKDDDEAHRYSYPVQWKYVHNVFDPLTVVDMVACRSPNHKVTKLVWGK